MLIFIMRGICIFALFWTLSNQSELFNLLSTTDTLIEAFKTNQEFNIDDFKTMVRRTYNLEGDKKVFKRSMGYEKYFLEEAGTYILNDIVDIGAIPAKFPNDINVFSSSNSSSNLPLIVSLEANESDPEVQLANNLVLYQYLPTREIKEVSRIRVFGGVRAAIYSFQNDIYVIAAEHDAKITSDSFEGSVLYKILEKDGKIGLKKIQILNVKESNYVELWKHQEEFYLTIVSSAENNTTKSGIYIYKWMGYHFDCIQLIYSEFVKCVVPFTIGSFMYLAVANYQNEHGNTDISSNIYRFHLSDSKFHLFQTIKTHGAQHISYFKFENRESKKSEHFLAVANYIGKNSNGALTSFLESVIYKFNGNHFVPFQSFKLLGATQWLPIKGSKGEFLLLVFHSNGLRGYQYDGWRFNQVSLKFGQSTLGENIQTMRTFNYQENTYLIISDKISHGEDINLWKLSFVNKNDMKEIYDEIKEWCQTMTSTVANDNFTKAIEKLQQKEGVLENRKLQTENFKQNKPPSESFHEIESLNNYAEELNEQLRNAENITKNRGSYNEIPIVIGSEIIPQLEIKCRTRNCVIFKNLKVLKLNEENFTKFLNNVVSIENNTWNFEIVFENIFVENIIFAHTINAHPFGTLVDVSSETFFNSELVVNGTVFIKNNLNIDGLFDGITIDKDNLLLYNYSQTLDCKLTANLLNVDNLEFHGILNRHSIQDLFFHPKIKLHNTYEKLNVNNIIVDGYLNEYNVKELLRNATKTINDQEIEGDINFADLEAEEVFVTSQGIFNVSINDNELSNPCSIRTLYNKKPEDETSGFRSTESTESFLNSLKNDLEEQDIIIVVQGILKVNDILDYTKTNSFLTILKDSLSINETIINLPMKFLNISVENIDVNEINGVSVQSLILKNSSKVQRITGSKTFSSDIRIENQIIVKNFSKTIMSNSKNGNADLEGDELIFEDWMFDVITCDVMLTNFTNFGNQSSNKVNHMIIKNSVVADILEVKQLMVKGKIDNVSWINFLEDSIFDYNDFVEAEKIIKGNLHVNTLNLNGRINDRNVDELLEQVTKNLDIIILNKDVVLEESLNVKELNFEGMIDSILRPNFKKEWILQSIDQTFAVPVAFENVNLKSGSILKNEITNNINLKKLFLRSLKVNEDAKIKYFYALSKVKVNVLDVEGRINGADFNTSVMRSNSEKRQDLSGIWLFENDININGYLITESFVSGLNISQMCQKKDSKKINLVVGGKLEFQSEPNIIRANNIYFNEKIKELWMKYENITLKRSNVTFTSIAFENKATILGYLNNVNLTTISNNYLSKTKNRVAASGFEFDNIIIKKWGRMRKANVNGTVNGINLSEWANNILLQDEEQTVNERLTFNVFEASHMILNGTVNKMDLLKDVLRYDVENVKIKGEKTFESIRVLNMTTKDNAKIQGVDISKWKNNLVTSKGNFNFKGNLTIDDAEFLSSVIVSGKVNGIFFDNKHLLLKNGNQVITGKKYFDLSDNLNVSLRIKNLEFFGLIDNLDIDSWMKMQAYSNQNLIFFEPQTFTKGFKANIIDFDGVFQSVNASGMCHNLLNPVNVNELEKKFQDLSEMTEAFIDITKGGVFYFDYLESIQTLKPNIKAVLPTVDSKGHYLSVLTSDLMKFMRWNEYSETFVNADESLFLKDNIKFVASATEKNPFLYIESSDSLKIFVGNRLQEIEGKDTSCVASFRLNALNRSCIFIGHKFNSSRILCSSSTTKDLRTYQWLESKGSVQVTVLTIKDEVYLAVINKEDIMDKFENSLTIYRFDTKLQYFYESHTLAEVNPVAVSSISYKDSYYLVSAGGHLPESVHNSIISIFRFNKNRKVFVRSKSIQVDTPVDVQLALLPSNELALYVLTSNPTKPLVVYLHRGIAGFVEETSGLSLYPGSNIYSFTDSNNRHFVIISGLGKGQILKAGFKGGNNKLNLVN